MLVGVQSEVFVEPKDEENVLLAVANHRSHAIKPESQEMIHVFRDKPWYWRFNG
jgi:hypothetical protein